MEFVYIAHCNVCRPVHHRDVTRFSRYRLAASVVFQQQLNDVVCHLLSRFLGLTRADPRHACIFPVWSLVYPAFLLQSLPPLHSPQLSYDEGDPPASSLFLPLPEPHSKTLSCISCLSVGIFVSCFFLSCHSCGKARWDSAVSPTPSPAPFTVSRAYLLPTTTEGQKVRPRAPPGDLWPWKRWG